jgi:hypothetical protein
MIEIHEMNEIKKENMESSKPEEGSPIQAHVRMLPNSGIRMRDSKGNIVKRRRYGRHFIGTELGISEWRPVLKLSSGEENNIESKSVGSFKDTERSHLPSAQEPHSRSAGQNCTTSTTSLWLCDEIKDATKEGPEERTKFLREYFGKNPQPDAQTIVRFFLLTKSKQGE